VEFRLIHIHGGAENAGVEKAGVNRIERQPDGFILREPKVTSFYLSLFFRLNKVCLLFL